MGTAVITCATTILLWSTNINNNVTAFTTPSSSFSNHRIVSHAKTAVTRGAYQSFPNESGKYLMRSMSQQYANPSSKLGPLFASSIGDDSAGDILPEKIVGEGVGSEKLTESMITYPKLILFWLSICGNWFVEPLQSLVDTIVVGQVSTLQLAALGPASIGFDSIIFMCYFLAIATTNQLGTAIANNDEEEQQKITSNNLGVSIVIGLSVMALIYGQGHTIMKFMVGADNVNLIPAALSYTQIRVTTVLASLFLMVTQAASFSYLDTLTPVIAVLTATTINCIGDYILCIKCNYGIKGAAMATALGQLVAGLIMLVRMRKPLTKGNKPMITFPGPNELIKLIKLAGPILFLIIGELTCHMIMTKRITSFSVLDLAAHSVLLRIYIFFGIFGESVSQTVQSFFPRLMSPKKEDDSTVSTAEEEEKQILNKLFRKKLWTLAYPIGLLGSGLAYFTCAHRGSFFVKDSQVLSGLKVAAPFMGSVLMLNPFNMMSDGLAMSQKQFASIILSYVTSIIALTLAMPFCTNLSHVWTSFMGFQVLRFVQRTALAKYRNFRDRSSQTVMAT